VTAWVFASVATPVGSAPEARFDGTFPTYGEATDSLHAALLDADVDPWRATSPQNVGVIERIWWTGSISDGEYAAAWRPGVSGPVGARIITRMQLNPDYTIT
jgi:hypothetical protein